MARVEEHPGQRAVAHLANPCERMVHLDVAGRAAKSDRPEHEHPPIYLPDVVGGDFVKLEVPVDLGSPLPDAGVPAIGLSALVQSRVLRPDLDIWVAVADPVVDVALIPARKRLTDDLDVFFRLHRAKYRPRIDEWPKDLARAPTSWSGCAAIVNPMVNDPFKALSHPIRRGIVERLAAGPATVGDATAGFGVSKPAISKHIKVLEETGVLTREVEGRTHRLSLDTPTLDEAAEWMDRQRALWGRMFDVVDDYLKEKQPR
jgi:DNA-binding transcriptional ArsR family regulator